MDKQPYQKPTVTELGSLRDHTQITQALGSANVVLPPIPIPKLL